jgi:DNA polymerase III gamma/tau subunit
MGAVGNDLREVDSADFRGIDTVRDMRKQSAFKPLEGDCRVWILDECHKMSSDAQSALLKALEDAPKHVYYILCTTDPQKLLSTIKGRCSQFVVSTLTDKEMKILLRRVTKAEGESLTKDIYAQIIQDSLGHPRDALQILAQVLAVDGDKRLEVATHAAEVQSQTIELCRALIQPAPVWNKIATILTGLKDQEPESIRRAVLGYCQAVLLKNGSPNIAQVMGEFIEPFYNTGFPGLTYACYCAIDIEVY